MVLILHKALPSKHSIAYDNQTLFFWVHPSDK